MIPDFNISSVLPPYVGEDGPAQPHSASPYVATMSGVVLRFGTSSARLEILLGLLNYRKALRDQGIESGFQWLDGSFVENVEETRGRPPGDIDVVTFFKRPLGHIDDTSFAEFVKTNMNLFNPLELKTAFRCDAYAVDLDTDPEYLVGDTSYWYGLFSHQRDSFLWKGMVRVDLSSDDEHAQELVEYKLATEYPPSAPCNPPVEV